MAGWLATACSEMRVAARQARHTDVRDTHWADRCTDRAACAYAPRDDRGLVHPLHLARSDRLRAAGGVEPGDRPGLLFCEVAATG